MSKTKDALNKLTEVQRTSIDGYKKRYNHGDQWKKETRLASAAYLRGLYESGVISDVEKRLLHCYITL